MTLLAPVLNTDRLTLVPLDSSFCSETYVQWMNDEMVTANLETGAPYSIRQLQAFLEEQERNPKLFWAILLKGFNRHIGNIKIDPVNHGSGTGEYGIMIGDTSVWGKGYAREASQAVIGYCFTELGLSRIELGLVADNEAALGLYKKMGFQIDSVYPYTGRHHTRCNRAIRMSLTVDDWTTGSQKKQATS